jgi:hypothetical protein
MGAPAPVRRSAGRSARRPAARSELAGRPPGRITVNFANLGVRKDFKVLDLTPRLLNVYEMRVLVYLTP